MKKYLSLLLFLYSSSLLAVDFYSLESRYNLEETRFRVEELLKKIDDGNFKMIDETLGFHYGWVSRWLSPFSYKIYVTALETRNPVTILRVEGNSGDALAFRFLFYQEKLSKEELEDFSFQPLKPKNHLFSQTLNFLHPALAVIYNNYESPVLTASQAWWRGFWYFTLDALLIWAAGKNWFSSRWNPEKYKENIIGVMILTRAIGSIQSMNLTRAHNRYYRLGYQFPLHLF